jgi:hypothetical protein
MIHFLFDNRSEFFCILVAAAVISIFGRGFKTSLKFLWDLFLHINLFFLCNSSNGFKFRGKLKEL